MKVAAMELGIEQHGSPINMDAVATPPHMPSPMSSAAPTAPPLVRHSPHWAGLTRSVEGLVQHNQTSGHISPDWYLGSTLLENTVVHLQRAEDAGGARRVQSRVACTGGLVFGQERPGDSGTSLQGRNQSTLLHSIAHGHGMVQVPDLRASARLSGARTAFRAILGIFAVSFSHRRSHRILIAVCPGQVGQGEHPLGQPSPWQPWHWGVSTAPSARH